jgi:hypothetical protein
VPLGKNTAKSQKAQAPDKKEKSKHYLRTSSDYGPIGKPFREALSALFA